MTLHRNAGMAGSCETLQKRKDRRDRQNGNRNCDKNQCEIGEAALQ